jgi:hypothetical protein
MSKAQFSTSHVSADNNNNNGNIKLFGAVGGSLLLSSLALSYYYNKRLKSQQEEFDKKLQSLLEGKLNYLTQSTQFNARIAPGPVPTLQLSSPVFQPIAHNNVNNSANLPTAITASPRLMPRRSAVIVVDPVSTGANVANEITKRGNEIN